MQIPGTHHHCPRVLAAGIATFILGGIGFAGCFAGNEGDPPPRRGFYFPTGLAVSKSRSALYVANSDFDLQFNGGTVQVINLRALRGAAFRLRDELLSAPAPDGKPKDTWNCGDGTYSACCAVRYEGDRKQLVPNGNELIYPGPCSP